MPGAQRSQSTMQLSICHPTRDDGPAQPNRFGRGRSNQTTPNFRPATNRLIYVGYRPFRTIEHGFLGNLLRKSFLAGIFCPHVNAGRDAVTWTAGTSRWFEDRTESTEPLRLLQMPQLTIVPAVRIGRTYANRVNCLTMHN